MTILYGPCRADPNENFTPSSVSDLIEKPLQAITLDSQCISRILNILADLNPVPERVISTISPSFAVSGVKEVITISAETGVAVN